MSVVYETKRKAERSKDTKKPNKSKPGLNKAAASKGENQRNNNNAMISGLVGGDDDEEDYYPEEAEYGAETTNPGNSKRVPDEQEFELF